MYIVSCYVQSIITVFQLIILYLLRHQLNGYIDPYNAIVWGKDSYHTSVKYVEFQVVQPRFYSTTVQTLEQHTKESSAPWYWKLTKRLRLDKKHSNVPDMDRKTKLPRKSPFHIVHNGTIHQYD